MSGKGGGEGERVLEEGGRGFNNLM